MLILKKEHHERLEHIRKEVDKEAKPAQTKRADDKPQASKVQPRVVKSSGTELKKGRLTVKPEHQPKVIIDPIPRLRRVSKDISKAPVVKLKERPLVNEVLKPNTSFPDVLTEQREAQTYAKPESLGPPEVDQAPDEPISYTAADGDLETAYIGTLLQEEDAVEIINSVEVGSWEHEEVLFDDEVLETFTDLMVALDPEAGGPVVPNLFEEFIADEDRPEVVPDIETIIVNANEQPLEETLVQLSFSLVETSSQDYDLSSIESALKDVVEALGQDSVDLVITEAEQVITPELTQKLLILLRAVGYEDPREVLVDFVSQHNLEFLLQAIRYLYQLLDDDRRELSPRVSVSLSSLRADDALGARLGRAILYHFFGENTVTLASS